MLKNADSTFFLKFYLRILFLEKILHCHHYFHLSPKKTLFKKFKNNKISIKTKMSKFETFVFIIACILAISIDSSESNLITNLINNIQNHFSRPKPTPRPTPVSTTTIPAPSCPPLVPVPNFNLNQVN